MHLRKAKVGKLHNTVVVDQKVRTLQVAMDEAVLMHEIQAGKDLSRIHFDKFLSEASE